MRGLLGVILSLLCLSLQAKEYTVESVPMPKQLGNVYVSNPDDILSAKAALAIDTTLYALEKQTGIQVLVVALEQIEGGDCFDFAYRLGRDKGVGEKGRDNGLVILLVTEERCIQFVTGYGIEGDLPDALCKQIQQRYMNRAFAKGDWNTGMLAGVQAVRQVLDGSMERTPRQQGESNSLLFFLGFGFCFILVTALLWYNARQRKRCPFCHKHTFNEVSAHTVSVEAGMRTEEVLYRCASCGFSLRRHRKTRNPNDDSHHPGGFGGIFMGGPFFGGFGSGRGGGGFDGGSFGGGDFGGGGAGSRF